MFDFPMDKVLGQVEEFYEGASGSFFQTFNAYGADQVSRDQPYSCSVLPNTVPISA